MTLETGTRLDQYEILGSLGEGGMGEVYRARDHRLDRDVAIKILPAELVSDAGRLDRFEREAKLLASLNHPHIVTLHAVESEGDLRFFVMELVRGQSLEECLSAGALEIDRFLECALAISDAVAAAHSRGITHRDLKPANVMLSDSGWVKVLDFGIAKTTVMAAASGTHAPTAAMTQEGAVVGTLPYMSPEQLRGAAIGPASDVFSLGILFYEMATGERPFRGEVSVDLAMSILRDDPRPPSEQRTGLPEWLDGLMRRCLAKDPTDRFCSAVELRDELARSRDDTSSSPLPPASMASLGALPKNYRTPLVGREAESRRLREVLERTASGRGGVVTLAGEPGVGKTRLATETMRVAQSLGLLVLTGNCYEGEGSGSMSPWADIAQAVASAVPRAVFRELLGDGASEIARVQPALRRLYDDLPPPLDLPPEAERAYLFDCFCRFVENLCRRKPVLMVLEDLHWADEPTTLLLQSLAPQLDSMPVLVLGTYRDAELEDARPLSTALRELVRARLVERVSLSRLDAAVVAEMLEALSGQAPVGELVAAIHAATEGNPFFVEEVYQHLAEEDRLFDHRGRWREDLSLDRLDVPEGVRLVVGRRLERLNEEGRAVLTVAGVVGRRFGYSLLETLVEAEVDAVLECVEVAEQLHLIEPVGGLQAREVHYQFTHELIRQTLLQGLSPPRRQRLHQQVADAIETLHGEESDEQASSIAHHLYHAGTIADEAKTRRFLALAAEQAMRAGGFETARSHLEAALSLTRRIDENERAHLLWRLGLAQRSQGDWQQALENFELALGHCQPSRDPATFAAITYEHSLLAGWMGLTKMALDSALHGLEIIGEQEGPERCRLQAMAAMCLGSCGRDFEAGDTLIAEAIEGSAALREVALQGYAGLMKQYHHALGLRSRRAVRSGEAAVELLQSAGDVWSLVDARGLLRLSRVTMGLPEMGMSENQQLALRLGHFASQWWEAHGAAISVWILTADLDRFEQAIDEWGGVARAAGIGWWHVSEGARALARFWSGDLEGAREIALEAVAHEPEGALRGNQSSALFLIDSYLGRKQDALALLDRGLLPSEDLPPGGTEGQGSWTMLVQAVEGLWVLDERERAAGLYGLLLACARDRDRDQPTRSAPGSDCRRDRRCSRSTLAGGSGTLRDRAAAGPRDPVRERAGRRALLVRPHAARASRLG